MKTIKIKRSELNQLIFYVSMLIIPIFMFIILNIVTNIEYLLLSVREYNPETNGFDWVWFKNFATVIKELTMKESVLRSSLIHSVELWAWGLFLGMPLAILFSYYIARKKAGAGIFQVILFLPTIISSMVIIFVYSYFVDSALPALFYKLTGNSMNPPLGNLNTQWGMIIFYNVWISFGTNVLIFVGAITGISEEIIESAHLDGVNPVTELIYIVIPIIFSSISTFIVVGLASLFVNNAGLYSFFGPGASTQTIGYYLYKDVMEGTASRSDYSYLSAAGLVFSAIIIPITLLVKRMLEKITPEA